MTEQVFLGDSLEGVEDFEILELGAEGLSDPQIYTTASYSTWGNPDASSYFSMFVVKISFLGKSIYWHKWAVKPLKDVEIEILSSGINYHWDDIQTYNNRNIIGGKTKSMHSWPLALDINPARNPYRRDNKLITDIPPSIVSIFYKHNFKWGGSWRTIKDPMHFEYFGTPFKNYVEDTTTLQKGSKGEQVKHLQNELRKWGYNLEADGIFGEKTEAMVFSLQASKGIKVDGIVGKSTMDALIRPDRVLRKGMEGFDVKWIQRILERLKYIVTPDGVFGPNTDRFVRKFQKDNNIFVDGIVGPKTWFTLRKLSN